MMNGDTVAVVVACVYANDAASNGDASVNVDRDHIHESPTGRMAQSSTAAVNRSCVRTLTDRSATAIRNACDA